VSGPRTVARWLPAVVLAWLLGGCAGTESGNPSTDMVGSPRAGTGAAGSRANAGGGGTSASPTGGTMAPAGSGAGGMGAGAGADAGQPMMDAGVGGDEDGGTE
jgi:hypothetical protein